MARLDQLIETMYKHKATRLVLASGSPAQLMFGDDARPVTEGPLKPEWRRTESSWALAPEREIAAAETRIRELRRGDRLGAYLSQHDARRSQVGQMTYVVARKL